MKDSAADRHLVRLTMGVPPLLAEGSAAAEESLWLTAWIRCDMELWVQSQACVSMSKAALVASPMMIPHQDRMTRHQLQVESVKFPPPAAAAVG